MNREVFVEWFHERQRRNQLAVHHLRVEQKRAVVDSLIDDVEIWAVQCCSNRQKSFAVLIYEYRKLD
ncbi:hypothetical protein Hsar01_03636 [Haloferula sargassicola]|uniref:Uncharacterized protein n=1 Tax=Haloferula sargassicola TaxID=490096 RepID=A0ABP9USI6_9BACT